jgi:6-pyruvoyltetrahydropterin/6-carboxytetrahydropterin synthase
MYELFAEDSFSAAHRLVNYAGNCSNWHGHNWTVRAVLAAGELDEMGLACDLRDIKRALADAVSPLDHAVLNDVPGLEGLNPTCENLARFFYHTLSARLNSEAVRVTRVEVSETPSSGAAYFE